MKPTKSEYSIPAQSNTRARVRIASCLWLGILNCLALVIWHQSTEPKALSNSLSGPAWVRDIEPCQGLLPRDGQVITATFQHSCGDVIDLVWSDDGSRNLESIGTTSNHPFYSFDRGDYVQAGSLQEGERLLTYSGDTKRVVSKLARPGPKTVYNLEVFGEHVYFIGNDGVLVHNSDSYGLNAGVTSRTVDDALTRIDIMSSNHLVSQFDTMSSGPTALMHQTTSGALLRGTPGRTTTVLGNFKMDIEHILKETGDVKSLDFGAKPGSFNILNVPNHLYKTPKQFFKDFNRPWLDAALSRNDIILFATKPEMSVLSRPNTATGKIELSGFGREYLYLRKNGLPSRLNQ